MANANKLTLFIVIFMLMGILSGAAIHAYATPTTVSAWRTILRCSPICFCG
ncbi:hypothetical protein M3O75_16090 [Klebsiella pneumoniae]|nr:hypothetical protein [Klebsiella pneumoniae]